jgi:hypothetical protein
MFLSIPEGIGIYDIELDMMSVEAEITPDKSSQATVTIFILKEPG